MNREKQFHISVRALVKAYLNDTLESFDCQASAVGHIVAEANGYKVCRLAPHVFAWADEHGKHISDSSSWYRVNYGLAPNVYVKNTGYTRKEIEKIEEAFMSVYSTYEALMATVDVLCEIHGMNEEVKKESKEMFEI